MAAQAAPLAVSLEGEYLLGSFLDLVFRPLLAIEVSLVTGQEVPPVDLALEVLEMEALQLFSLGVSEELQVVFYPSCYMQVLDFFLE